MRALVLTLAGAVACSSSGSPTASESTPVLPYRSVASTAPAPAERRTNVGAPLRYRLTFGGRVQHRVDVEGRIPTDGQPILALMMAVWTPGSYLVRDYPGALETPLEAFGPDQRPLAVRKVAKNRWQVTTEGAAEVVLRYRLYAARKTVRENFVDAEIAIINGAATFITRTDALGRTHEVTLERPQEWRAAVTGLPRAGDTTQDVFVATGFDHLVDSPIVLGSPRLYHFEVQGIPHTLANFGEDGVWAGARSAADVQKVVQTVVDFWGTIPYQPYVFLNVLGQGRGGLEHLNSTLMMASRWATGTPEKYRSWLGLVAHEFFHTWNVKRLRPVALGPFDYERENPTTDLWVAEGVTSYYDDLMLRRAGLISEKTYLELLSKQIESVESTPGRQVQSLESASFDAWIKAYRSNENSVNATISYYRKGAVVGFLLDTEIRRATANRRSLDTVMRRAYERFSGEEGYSSEAFAALVSEVAGKDLQPFLDRALRSTKELDYEGALDWFGLRFRSAGRRSEDGEASTPGWLGLEVDALAPAHRFEIGTVRRGTPAFRAGVNVGDEILGLDGFRVTLLDWEDRRRQYRPEQRAELLVARRGRLLKLPVVFGEELEKSWELVVDMDATGPQNRRREAWLSP